MGRSPRDDGAEGVWVWTRRALEQPDLRVSTAERSEVAEALSKHYADGRLDAAEFDERLGRAMGAKTRGDLSGLLDDLPGPGPLRPAPPGRPRRPRLAVTVVFGLLLAFAVSTTVATVAAAHVAFWLVVALVALVVLRHRGGHHHHRALGPPG